MKAIEGYNGLYSVTEDGEVWSNVRPLSQKVNYKFYPRKRSGFFLKKYLKNGYYYVTLNNKGAKSFYVHRLVLKTFVPNTENKKTVNHINGVKTDNRLENLEWATYAENSLHAKLTGLIPVRVKKPPKARKPTKREIIRKYAIMLHELRVLEGIYLSDISFSHLTETEKEKITHEVIHTIIPS